MTAKIAINGFGRIGRLVFRALFESKRTDLEIVAINDLADTATNAHLLKYDSVHGTFPFTVDVDGTDLIVDGKRIKTYSERNPEDLPWGDHGIDLVAECSGVFTARDKAALHINAGAKKVLISAPSGDADNMIVYGVNHKTLEPSHKVVSNASCTTNCLSPVAYVLHKEFGIEKGFMTTIHSYTGDQRTVDTMHKDLHRARAAGINMIPTSTGAAKAVGKILPELNGKLDGVSIRVPTPNVSLVDFKLQVKKPASVEAINAAIHDAAKGELKGVLDYYHAPLVSSDFNHNPHSSIFSCEGTKVLENDFVRVMSWYDNEWGFSNRMLDTAALMVTL